MAVGLANFLPALVDTVQTGYLDHVIKTALAGEETFRAIAEQKVFPHRIGQTVTDTRAGFKAPIAPGQFLDPATNTNFDNGLVPSGWGVEQYTFTLSRIGDTQDLNIVTETVGIIDQFVHDNLVNAKQAGQSVDRWAQYALYGAYTSANSMVATTLAAAGTQVAVSDIRGFMTAPQAGFMTPVSASNPLNARVGSSMYAVVGAAADATNSNTGAPGAVSGVLTFATSVTTADATKGNAVIASNAPMIVRPNGVSSFSALTATNMLTLSVLLDAVTLLRRNAVPAIDGYYNCYLDDTSARQLFADPDFKQAWQGQGNSVEFRRGSISALLGLRFMHTTELAPQIMANGVVVHRPIICGAGALIEAQYNLTPEHRISTDNQAVSYHNGIKFVSRMPLDRLGEIMAISWTYAGAFTVPTDLTATSATIPTASNSAYKRAVMIEHGGAY